jgi:hypothetical protein
MLPYDKADKFKQDYGLDYFNKFDEKKKWNIFVISKKKEVFFCHSILSHDDK